MAYDILKWIHIISSAVLFGTGLGSAFYKWHADRSSNIQVIVHSNRIVVIADWIFTTPTVIIQPVTGILLAKLGGYPLNEFWLMAAMLLFALAGLCWLPVLWLQIQMHKLSQQAIIENTSLSHDHKRYARLWFYLGIPAFTAMMLVYYLMVSKPAFF